jgi:serine/threonine protein kinase
MKTLEKDMKQGTIPLILPQIPSVESLHILSSCLTLEERERISISELVSHPFIDLSYKTTPIFQK